MAVSKAKSAANARWDAKNTHIFSVKVRNAEADAFQAACAANGTTPYGVLLAAVRSYIAANAAPTVGDGVAVEGVQTEDAAP